MNDEPRDTLTKALDDMTEIFDLALEVSEGIATLRKKISDIDDFEEALKAFQDRRFH